MAGACAGHGAAATCCSRSPAAAPRFALAQLYPGRLGRQARDGRWCERGAQAPRWRCERRRGAGAATRAQQQQEDPGPSLQAVLLKQYDRMLQSRVKDLAESEKRMQEMQRQLEELEGMGAPGWALGSMRWAVEWARKVLDQSRKDYQEAQAQRAGFERDLSEAADDVAKAQANEEAEAKLLQEMLEKETPDAQVVGTMLGALGAATFLPWIASFFDVPAARLLVLPSNLEAAGAAWVGWTLPFLGATLLTYAAAPQLTTQRVLRRMDTDPAFLALLAPWALAASGVGVAYSYCIVYQGMWQEVIAGWLGASRDAGAFTDPAALEETVKASMGSLAATRGLPRFLLAPATALAVGALEGGWHALTCQLYLFAETSNPEVGEDSRQRFVDGRPLSETEVVFNASRIALASAYLSLEATLSGSLWLSVGTSAAGVLTVMLLGRAKGRGEGGSGGGEGSAP